MKTAIILTARKERESDIPYPLLAFDGKQCLIDRTLSILREISVDKIVLIVGYRSELFNKYRSEDVVILKAANYEFTGSRGKQEYFRECPLGPAEKVLRWALQPEL